MLDVPKYPRQHPLTRIFWYYSLD